MARLLPLLFYAQQLFSLWMTVDALRRRADRYWYIVIWFPFGEWVYFFAVKIHDYPLLKARIRGLLARPPSLESLRHQADHNPCVASKLHLADALHDQGEHEEAAGLYREVLKRDPQDHAALHGCALAERALEQHNAAGEKLERLIELAPAFRNHAGYTDLAQTYRDQGKTTEVVETLRALVATSPQFEHEVALAEALLESNERAEAQKLLRTALDHYKHAPSYQRRRQGRTAIHARKLLKQLASQPIRTASSHS